VGRLASVVFVPQVIGSLTRTGGADFDVKTGNVFVAVLYPGFLPKALKAIFDEIVC
jgi:hypothetical protein